MRDLRIWMTFFFVPTCYYMGTDPWGIHSPIDPGNPCVRVFFCAQSVRSPEAFTAVGCAPQGYRSFFTPHRLRTFRYSIDSQEILSGWEFSFEWLENFLYD